MSKQLQKYRTHNYSLLNYRLNTSTVMTWYFITFCITWIKIRKSNSNNDKGFFLFPQLAFFNFRPRERSSDGLFWSNAGQTDPWWNNLLELTIIPPWFFTLFNAKIDNRRALADSGANIFRVNFCCASYCQKSFFSWFFFSENAQSTMKGAKILSHKTNYKKDCKRQEKMQKKRRKVI